MITAETKPRRRWFRFGLRTLFVVVTLVAIGCVVAPDAWMVWTRRAALREVEQRGGRIKFASDWSGLDLARWAARGVNRLTYCFSKKLRNLEAAFAMFAAYYNFCWQTRKLGKSGQKRGTAAMMAGLSGHVLSFDELFDVVLGG